MKRSVTNIVHWCIAALSGALLVAAAHAETPHAATAEEITASAEASYTARRLAARLPRFESAWLLSGWR
jgi:hypothetical protein